MADPALLERTEVLPDLSREIPCSGTGHFTGYDRHLHGDPSQPAEWLILQRCPSCSASYTRPVCDYFKVHGLEPDRMVDCTFCKKLDTADRVFTVLRRL